MRMRSAILTVFIFTVLIIGGSCQYFPEKIVEPDSISNNSTGLVPFKIGNKWYYNYYYYDTTGAQMQGFHYDSAVVSRDTIIGKERWYKIVNFKPPNVDYLDWYTNRSDGICVLRRVINHFEDTAYAYLTFKYPGQVGEFWGSILRDSTRILSLNDLITTPLGVDTCIHYEDHYEFSNLGDDHYYFAPKKGWVMLELFSRTNSGRLYVVDRLVLIKIVLK
jgi:hypothetical protein